MKCRSKSLYFLSFKILPLSPCDIFYVVYLLCFGAAQIQALFVNIDIQTRRGWSERVLQKSVNLVDDDELNVSSIFHIAHDDSSLLRPSNILLINSIGFPQTMRLLAGRKEIMWWFVPSLMPTFPQMFDVSTHKLLPQLYCQGSGFAHPLSRPDMFTHMCGYVETIVYSNNSSN